jgi:hypothetical protein
MAKGKQILIVITTIFFVLLLVAGISYYPTYVENSREYQKEYTTSRYELRDLIEACFYERGKSVIKVEDIPNVDTKQVMLDFDSSHYKESDVRRWVYNFVDRYVEGNIVLRAHYSDRHSYIAYGVVNEVDGIRIFQYIRLLW